MYKKKDILIVLLISKFQSSVAQKRRPVLDIMLTNSNHPFEMHFINIKSQNRDLKMSGICPT